MIYENITQAIIPQLYKTWRLLREVLRLERGFCGREILPLATKTITPLRPSMIFCELNVNNWNLLLAFVDMILRIDKSHHKEEFHHPFGWYVPSFCFSVSVSVIQQLALTLIGHALQSKLMSRNRLKALTWRRRHNREESETKDRGK